MDRILIRGGKRLSGKIAISGAKNSALALMPCALLTDEPLTLRNLPRLADADGFGHLLNELGASTEIEGTRPNEFGRVLTVRSPRLTSTVAPYDIVRKMRASILLLAGSSSTQRIRAPSIRAGVTRAAEAIDSGAAARTLEAMARGSRQEALS